MRLIQRTVSLQPGESRLVCEDNYNGGELLEVAAFGEGDSSIFLDGPPSHPPNCESAELSVLWLAKLWPKTFAFREAVLPGTFLIDRSGLYVRLPESAENPVLVVLFLMLD